MKLNQILHRIFSPKKDNALSLDLDDFVYEYGNGHQAILYSCLFMPPLIEWEGSIFFSSCLKSQEMKNRFSKLKKEKKLIFQI